MISTNAVTNEPLPFDRADALLLKFQWWIIYYPEEFELSTRTLTDAHPYITLTLSFSLISPQQWAHKAKAPVDLTHASAIHDGLHLFAIELRCPSAGCIIINQPPFAHGVTAGRSRLIILQQFTGNTNCNTHQGSAHTHICLNKDSHGLLVCLFQLRPAAQQNNKSIQGRGSWNAAKREVSKFKSHVQGLNMLRCVVITVRVKEMQLIQLYFLNIYSTAAYNKCYILFIIHFASLGINWKDLELMYTIWKYVRYWSEKKK